MANEKRLIDANALKKEIVDFKINLHPQNQDYATGYFSGLSVVEGMLAYAPTVDAVEVVHGRWIHVPSSDMMTGKAYKCSECNKMRYGSFMPNYCQNCGAKMDGDGNE